MLTLENKLKKVAVCAAVDITLRGKDRSPERCARNLLELGESVTKYHRTLTTYLMGLLNNGFEITAVAEPMPPEDMLDLPGMKDEMRRPMMLIVRAVKK